jgi:hypothetical protein
VRGGRDSPRVQCGWCREIKNLFFKILDFIYINCNNAKI